MGGEIQAIEKELSLVWKLKNARCVAEGVPVILSIKDTVYGKPISNWVHIKVHVSREFRPTFPEGAAFLSAEDAIMPAEFQAIADHDREADEKALNQLKSSSK